MKGQEKPVVSARIHRHLWKRLVKYCQTEGLTRQEVIEKALARFLRG